MPTQRKYASSAQRQAAYRARRRSRTERSPCRPVTGSVYRRWESLRKQAASLLEEVASEMESYHTQRSDAWRDSERGEAFTEIMESVAEAARALGEIPSRPSEP